MGIKRQECLFVIEAAFIKCTTGGGGGGWCAEGIFLKGQNFLISPHIIHNFFDNPLLDQRKKLTNR